VDENYEVGTLIGTPDPDGRVYVIDHVHGQRVHMVVEAIAEGRSYRCPECGVRIMISGAANESPPTPRAGQAALT
jgi:hypothetical protein